MAATEETKNKNSSNDTTATAKSDVHRKIDINAPAGSENSLGAESVRDGRPATDDSVVEAIDEMNPSS